MRQHQELKELIKYETRDNIYNSSLNPSGYKDENYESAYMQCFGDDCITKEQECIFDKVIEEIWKKG